MLTMKFYAVLLAILTLPTLSIGQIEGIGDVPVNNGISISDDLSKCGYATDAEKNKHSRIQKTQLGVDVSAGESTKPFYYHHNEDNEKVYKYDKKNIGKDLDCWYPVQPERACVCGKLTDIYKTSPDFDHKYLTQDRDFNLLIYPSGGFKQYLKNRWAAKNGHSDQFKYVEGEVNVDDLDKDGLHYSNKNNSTNPLFRKSTKIKKGMEICIYGPWMWDKLHGLKVFSKDGQGNNEIHPINQFWFGDLRKGLTLTSVMDGSDQFDKQDATQVAASGQSQTMRYYIPITINRGKVEQYIVIGENFDAFMGPIGDKDRHPITLSWDNIEVVRVTRLYATGKKMYKAFFSEMRKVSESSINGYLVIETEAIHSGRGSVTVIVKKI